MKVLSTDGLTKLIQLIKSSFISVNDTVTTNTVTLATVATSGSYNDLSDKPTIQIRDVGEIVPSIIPLTDAGLHLLDGSLISGSGTYSAFVTYIAGLVSSYPNLFITESAWQTSVTDYGVCGKFVYDIANNTVRLPKITGIMEGTIDATALGDLVEAGLPNITGQLSASGQLVNDDANNNALDVQQTGGSIGNYTSATSSTKRLLTLDASTSNPIYGNSDTAQPQTIKGFYYIVIANSTKTEIEVDIDEIATDLNGKADVDLTNCTKPHIVETYVNGTSWYRVWSDGWCEQGGRTSASSGSGYETITLLKPMADTNYTLLHCNNLNVQAIDQRDAYIISNTQIGVGYDTTSGIWKVEGYLLQE